MSNLFKNRQVIKLPKVNSTNTYLTQLAKSLPEGSIVWAVDQTNGRGQHTNKWNSEPGKNLTFSIVFHPVFLSAYQQFYVSKVVALAVSDFISLYTDKVSIKWPNDIYVDHQKIGGILIEHVIEKTFIKQTIAGIGVNINQGKFPGNLPNPVSLTQLSGQKYNVEELLSEIILVLDYRYSMLKNNELQTIDKNFNEILYQYLKPSKYISNDETFEGTITGVEATGELIIKDKTGKIRKFLHKEVEFVL
jgi:BirA family biotin operon repressor/biotin-[acetyl-CoA-carboxylase] ligase